MKKHWRAGTSVTADWLIARKNATATKDFLIIDQTSLTFAEVNGRVEAACQAIQRHVPVQAGDRVALLMPTSRAYVLSLLALMRLGALAVPLNTRLTPTELRWQLKHTECRLVICHQETAALAAEIADCGCAVVSFDKLAWEERKEIPHLQPRTPSFDLDADFAIIHSSGTSGRPKAVALTRDNMYQSAVASAHRLGVLPDDRWLCALPLYHVGGLSIVLRSLLYGTAVEFVTTPKFDVDVLNRVLSQRPITLVSLVPTMLRRLLDARRAAWNPKLRLVLLGGEAPSAELLVRCLNAGIPIATTYGLSEAASQVATATPQQLRQKPLSVGKPLLFTQVRIIDKQGQDMPPKGLGEVLVKGPTVMRGYDKDPAATREALREGWLYTGDMGYLDEDGDLYICQRRADLIITGGENVYPLEVENVLREHPAIEEAVVVGVADAEWGQRVAAAVQVKHGKSLSRQEVMRFAREKMAGYKIPRKFCFVEAFPRTASGKIQRQAVKKLFNEDD